MPKQNPTCPKCSSKTTLSYCYGLCLSSDEELKKKGLISAGSCVSNDDSPTNHCPACGLDFIPKSTLINRQLELLTAGNQEYAKFNKKIVNTKKAVWGVRLPDMRRLAKKEAKNFDFSSLKRLLDDLDSNVFEQVLTAGSIINQVKLSDQQRLTLIKKYLTKVDSWALIDSFVDSNQRYQTDFWWQVATEMSKSSREFIARFGVIFMMSNFLLEDKIQQVLKLVSQIKNEAHYVKMAVAWLYATAAVDFYDLIFSNLKNNQLDKSTSKKACQKILESRRISTEQKTQIRELRKQFK